ncbi:hypothetical protein DXG01_006759, partial [Tephrocybe rancida]
MPPRIPPNTKLEQEWLLNKDHEGQEHERDQARLDALLAQQVLAPPSVPLVSTSPGHNIVHVTLIVEVSSQSPSLPPVSTLSIRHSPCASPAGEVPSCSLSPALGSSSSESPSGHPAPESSLNEDGNPELDELEDEVETGGESREVGSNPEEWGGILTDDLGSDPAHLKFVSDKLFFEVMRALHSEDPPVTWCASVQVSVPSHLSFFFVANVLFSVLDASRTTKFACSPSLRESASESPASLVIGVGSNVPSAMFGWWSRASRRWASLVCGSRSDFSTSDTLRLQ